MFSYTGKGAFSTYMDYPSSKTNKGVVIGASVGTVVAAICIAGLLAFCFYRRRKRLAANPTKEPTTPATSTREVGQNPVLGSPTTARSTFSHGHGSHGRPLDASPQYQVVGLPDPNQQYDQNSGDRSPTQSLRYSVPMWIERSGENRGPQAVRDSYTTSTSPGVSPTTSTFYGSHFSRPLVNNNPGTGGH